MCFMTLMFAPNWLFGTAFTYQRFALLLMPFFVMTIARSVAWPKWIWPACVVLVALSTGYAVVNVLKYRPDEMQFTRILDRMEPRSRALTFAFEWDGAGFIAPPFLHFPAVLGAQARRRRSERGRHAPYPGARRSAAGRACRHFEGTRSVEWTRYHGSYRYFVCQIGIGSKRSALHSAPCRRISSSVTTGGGYMERDAMQAPNGDAYSAVFRAASIDVNTAYPIERRPNCLSPVSRSASSGAKLPTNSI
jgi:hypothetical protein